MVTLATSARMISKNGQPDLFEPSTETGHDQQQPSQTGKKRTLSFRPPIMGPPVPDADRRLQTLQPDLGFTPLIVS